MADWSYSPPSLRQLCFDCTFFGLPKMLSLRDTCCLLTALKLCRSDLCRLHFALQSCALPGHALPFECVVQPMSAQLWRMAGSQPGAPEPRTELSTSGVCLTLPLTKFDPGPDHSYREASVKNHSSCRMLPRRQCFMCKPDCIVQAIST